MGFNFSEFWLYYFGVVRKVNTIIILPMAVYVKVLTFDNLTSHAIVSRFPISSNRRAFLFSFLDRLN